MAWGSGIPLVAQNYAVVAGDSIQTLNRIDAKLNRGGLSY